MPIFATELAYCFITRYSHTYFSSIHCACLQCLLILSALPEVPPQPILSSLTTPTNQLFFIDCSLLFLGAYQSKPCFVYSLLLFPTVGDGCCQALLVRIISELLQAQLLQNSPPFQCSAVKLLILPCRNAKSNHQEATSNKWLDRPALRWSIHPSVSSMPQQEFTNCRRNAQPHWIGFSGIICSCSHRWTVDRRGTFKQSFFKQAFLGVWFG